MWSKTCKKYSCIAMIGIMVMISLFIPSKVSASNANDIELTYTGHVQTYGWLNYSTTYTGTVGESKRMEALELNVDAPAGVTVKYRAHVQTYGWQDWVTADNKNGTNKIGTSGECKRVEAIQIVVEGSNDYTIKYRTQVQTYGWLDWVEAGDSTKVAETLAKGTYAGTSGESKRMEAMQIVVVPKEQSKIEETKKEEKALEQVQSQAEEQKQVEEQKQAIEAQKALEQAVEQKKEEVGNKTENPSTGHTHVFSDWTVTTKPTCVSTGVKTRKCISCEYTETQEIPGDPNGHLKIAAPELDKAPTCTTHGQSNTSYCAYCEQQFYTYIKELGHRWAYSPTTEEPTCTEYGTRAIHCTREGCTGEKDVTMIKPTGHSWGQYKVIKQASCIENGVKERQCTKCSSTETISTPMVAHNYSSEYTVDVEPTGTTLGYESRHCKTPGCTATTGTRSVSHKHTYSDDVKIIKKATCVEYGLQERTCTSCGKTFQLCIVPSGEHTLGEKHYGFEGNGCIGSTVYRECSTCGEKVWEQGFEPSEGHTWSSDDMETAVCTKCGTSINWTNDWAYKHDETAPGFEDGWKFNGVGAMRVRRVWWIQFKADTSRSYGFDGKEIYSPNTVITADYVYTATAPDPKPGYKFIGWCNAKTGTRISTDKTVHLGWQYAHIVVEAKYEPVGE